MLAPSDCDYLEIAPNRRIRVVHLYGRRGGEAAQSEVQPAPSGNLRRSSTTLSRTDVKPRTRLEEKHDEDDEDEDDESEDYWFENAAPKRMPIRPVEASKQAQRRIFNKFEPQKPPSIEGIRPPKASLAKQDVLESSSTACKSSSRSSPTEQTRLPRKVIIPDAQLDADDEEDLVRELPGENDSELNENDAEADGATSSVIEENFVANVLADMSGLVLNITADATDSAKSAVDRVDASSPTPDGKVVQSSPDPEDRAAVDGNVVVTDSNLGGVANVAFEGEEDNLPTESHSQEEEDQQTATESQKSQDSIDAGYSRKRDLSELLLSGDSNAGDDVDEEEEEDPVEGPQSVPMKLLPSRNTNNEESETNPSDNTSGPEEPFQDLFGPSSPAPADPKSLSPCLFFIHGVGGSAATWSTQLQYFSSRGFEVIAPDLLGHGFSSAPDNSRSYTFAKLFRDIVIIFDHYVRNDRTSCLVAHSYGTCFAAALARARPANVTSLLLLASGGPTPLAPPPVIKSVPSALVTACLKPFLRCGFRRQQR